MIVTFTEDGTALVTSPFMAGPADLVAKAQSCGHVFVTESSEPHEDNPQLVAHFQRCKKCQVTCRAMITGPHEMLVAQQAEFTGMAEDQADALHTAEADAQELAEEEIEVEVEVEWPDE